MYFLSNFLLRAITSRPKVIAPAIIGVGIVAFIAVRNAAADELDQKWSNRIDACIQEMTKSVFKPNDPVCGKSSVLRDWENDCSAHNNALEICRSGVVQSYAEARDKTSPYFE